MSRVVVRKNNIAFKLKFQKHRNTCILNHHQRLLHQYVYCCFILHHIYSTFFHHYCLRLFFQVNLLFGNCAFWQLPIFIKCSFVWFSINHVLLACCSRTVQHNGDLFRSIAFMQLRDRPADFGLDLSLKEFIENFLRGHCGALVYWLSLLHIFLQQSLNSGTA